MIVIDSKQLYEEYLEQATHSDMIVVPVLSSIYKHPARNKVCLLYVYLLSNQQEYIFTLNHQESLYTDVKIDEILNNTVYVYSKKKFKYSYTGKCQLIDLDLIHYFTHNTSININDIEIYDKFDRLYYEFKKINELIPITKHYEFANVISSQMIPLVEQFVTSKPFEYYNELYIDSFYEIEKNGLYVDYEMFLDKFGQNGLEQNLTFSEYNMFTTTGRPSNRYSGINYAALRKDDGCRKSFVSRHGKSGILIQFDYDSYHLKLISKLIGYKFPSDENIHTYLGKQFFNTDTLTKEQYTKSKEISFQQLYGGVRDEYKHIDFYNKTSDYIQQMWYDFKYDGFVETPLFNRKLHKHFFKDISGTKLFNYLLQAFETERNVYIINQLNEYLSTKFTKLVLYTYDSFLLDFNLDDGKETIQEVKRILEQGGMTSGIEIGSDYGTLQDTNI